MDVPPEQRRLLDAMTGTWLGEERLSPTPWDQRGGMAVGRTQARAGIGGLAVLADYAEERDGAIVFRGHGLYSWDAVGGTYCMYWFDSVLPCPTHLPARGTWDGDTLAFDVPGDEADYRYVYDFLAPGFYEFRIEYRTADAPWAIAMRGEYVRQ